MLKPQIHKSHIPQTLLAWQKPFFSGDVSGHFPVSIFCNPISGKARKNIPIRHAASSVKAIVGTTETITRIKAVVTVKRSSVGFLDGITDLVGRTLRLLLVAAELDPKTGLEKAKIEGYAHKKDSDEDEVEYEADFEVPESFGKLGAVLVENEQQTDMFVKKIVLNGFPLGPVSITCDSWVHSKFDNPVMRIFFTHKSYLPSQTPSGLKDYRERELTILRGDGTGERKKFDRIYDYDVYNDIGDPDSGDANARPVLGGTERPYPRRCRTGRPRTKTDKLSESREGDFYVPRDEAFSEVKGATFMVKQLSSYLRGVAPILKAASELKVRFPYFTAIDSLFNEGVNINIDDDKEGILGVLPRLIKAIAQAGKRVLLFETPEIYTRDRFSWIRNVEFSRQTLAGLNPCTIQLVTEWPLKSKLDPETYGPAESAITTELVEKKMGGFMTVKEAIKQKKLFILDYHDLLLPYVKKVRDLDGTTLYGSRTLFFLLPDSTLMPLAIELTRPKMDDKPQWREVYAPSWEATGTWLWKLAKVHVLSHDSGVHQLVSHWLRTHCATEPYIIATHRQLSAMHPIYALLHPHFRYTMEINALARQSLINENGVIETTFFPGKYSIEMSSVAYDRQWQFDLQALPADLINRGMAVEDPTAPHGLKLTIEDYPYANDGLILWDAIKQWAADYVNYYYPEPSLIESDQELQAWWTEIRTEGHADKKDEPWWPVLQTPDDLIGILTTIIWVASGHHAAVNFGQYDFAGYFPNRPTIARDNMPTEEPSENTTELFLKRPEDFLLNCFPSQMQATLVMGTLDVLSTHSPDEEYIGYSIEPQWAEEPDIKGAYEQFAGRLKELEGIIDRRNNDKNLKNRSGAGVVPYELLKPHSGPGVTGKGVPNSISI